MRMLYAGSFDPVTNGHMDIIERAAGLCDELIVAVMHNPDKRGAFPVSERVRLLEKACAHIANVRVIAHGGLLVQCAAQQGVRCVVRGVRPLGDFESEYQMAQVNRMLGGVETLMMPTSESLASISSSIVRQIAAFGGEIDGFVPACIAEDIRRALGADRE
ncbi:MAG: pantetheine-phosphate adenylyltransferase [Clostridia bacterium]|nr:pantetheine-phosphate adenylyltransferase [Clostridia bacterium]